jgi:DNA uptake protein ComE-like DNA-binding protein
VAYRLQHGEYQKATDLLGIKIFKSDWVEKISLYLSFETIGEKAGKD